MDKESESLLKKSSYESQSFLGCKIASFAIVLILVIAAFVASSHRKVLASVIDIPSIDSKHYKFFQLENGLEVLLIQKKDSEISAASLSVGIGSNADTIPGIAHFLEHMLFYASEAYPEEDYFRSFIENHNGYTNAYTNEEETNFFFTINSDNLEEALDIFSHAFIDPMLLEDAVIREVNAVNSEHERNKFSDQWRNFRLLEISTNEKHPLHNFSTGSSSTLNDENLVDKVQDFFDEYYKAGAMKLVILSRESTDKLQIWAMKYFSGVARGQKKDRGYPKDVFSLTEVAYLTPRISQGNTVTIIWPIPSELKFVESQPGDFISYLLNNPGIGGLSSTLQEWVMSLNAKIVLDLSDVSILGIDIEVNDEGLDHWKNVVSYVYGYLKRINNSPEIQLKALWKDYQDISRVLFDTRPEASADGIVSRIAKNMQKYPLERYISGADTISSLDLDQLQKTLKYTHPANAIYLISSSKFEKGYNLNGIKLDFPLVELNYDMMYQVESVKGISAIDHTSYRLIEHNSYIPKDLELKHCIQCSQNAELLDNNTKLELWYKFDTSFKQPKVFITLLFNSLAPDSNRSLLELHSIISQKSIDEELYLYSLAGNSINLSVDTRGILLNIQSWSSTVESYLESILRILSQPDLQKYSSSYKLLSNSFSSFSSSQPYFIALENLKRLIISGYTNINERYAELSEITLEKYRVFIEDLFKNGKALMYVDGNILPDDAIDLTIYVKNKYQLKNNGEVYIPVMTVVNGPVVYVSKEGLSNYAILNWYSFGQFDIKTWAALTVFGRLVENYSFSVLRTQEQLGYIVFSKIMDDLGTMGLVLIVQGSYKNPAEMNEIIQRFWNDLSVPELSDVVSQVAAQLEWPSESLEASHEDTWIEIIKNRKDMTFDSKLATEVLSVRQEDVSVLLSEIQSSSSELSVQVYMQSSEVTEKSINLNYFRDLNSYDKGFN